VPIQTNNLNRIVISSRKSSAPRQERQNEQDANANRDVNGVQSSHCEIKPEKQFRITWVSARPFKVRTGDKMFREMLVVFDRFDRHEHEAEERGAEQ
jgi:hypothetical protein